MEINGEEAIDQAKKLIHTHSLLHSFDEYSRGYLFTTEYIGRYLDQLTFNKNRALTILSSGDHVFNLLFKGINEIDTFDINRLNYFTFWLKKAFILNLSFREFNSLSSCLSSDFLLERFYQYLCRSKLDMPRLVFQFYEELISYEYSLDHQHNGLKNLYFSTHSSILQSNNYLRTKQNYLDLREKLKTLKLNMYFQDALSVPKLLEKEYDLILLSNVSDYLGTEEQKLAIEAFQHYISLYYELLAQDGVLVNYFYGYHFPYVIERSFISLSDLGKENVRKLSRGLFSEGYYYLRKD